MKKFLLCSKEDLKKMTCKVGYQLEDDLISVLVSEVEAGTQLGEEWLDALLNEDPEKMNNVALKLLRKMLSEQNI